MTAFHDITSYTVKLPESDIDTDQIVPARFLRTLAADGLGRYLFHDRRYTQQGAEIPTFPLSSSRYQGESILITGKNFGCGSSREHAPWALRDFGIRAVVGPSFGEIFFNNCLLNGLLPLIVDEDTWRDLLGDTGQVSISLLEQSLKTERWQKSFKIDSFARYCLLHGLSELDLILQNEPAIAVFETANRQYFPSLTDPLNLL